jgi:uncharacterized small protein (DUF1192 family)
MHPLYRPIVLIIGLCAVIIGLNVLMLLWLQARLPATPIVSRQADRTTIRLAEPPAKMAPCEPTVAGNEGQIVQIAEQDTVIARLEAEVERMKRAHVDDESAWRTKAENLEKDLMVLQKAAERVMEMDAENWQEGKIALAHAMVKKKP